MSLPLGQVEPVKPPALDALATELAKPIKSEQDIAALSRQWLKLAVASALKAELDEQLGYARHAPAGRGSGNSRTGYSSKTLKGDLGEVRSADTTAAGSHRHLRTLPECQGPNPAGPVGQPDSGLVRQGDDHPGYC